MNNINQLINTIINYKFDLKEPTNINSYIIPELKDLISNTTFNDLENYIKNSWFSDDILDSILPSLNILFKETKEKHEIQCAISMIIPQFERIIRDLCQQNNIIITNKGREEKTIGSLLQNRKLKTILGKNTWNYTHKVLLKDGLDIRDKFAHGFDNGLYNEKILEILFITIIILSNI